MTKRLDSKLLSRAADVKIGLHFIKEDYSAQSGVYINLFSPLHLTAFHMDGQMDFSPYEKFHHPCPSLFLYYIKNIHNLATQHLHYQSGDSGSSLHPSLTVLLKQTPNRFPASTFTIMYFQQNSPSDPFIKARLNNVIPLLQNSAKALHDRPLPYPLTSSPTALSLTHSALTILAFCHFSYIPAFLLP